MKNRRDKPLRRVSMENCNDYHCFDSTHLGKSFRTWERHFSIALLWPHPESHPNARRVIHPRCVRCRQRSNLQGQPRFITRPLLGLGPRACGLVRERFTQHLRCERPFHESWHKCVHEAIQSARNYSGPVFPQRVKALGYALLQLFLSRVEELRAPMPEKRELNA